MKKTVLVVSDDEKISTLLTKSPVNKEWTFSVEWTPDGEEAAEILKKGNISAVVTTLAMPEMGGLVFLDYIAKYCPSLQSIIIADNSTGNAENKAGESGAITYIKEPLDCEELTRKIFDIFQAQEEGGFLRDVALEVFAHIVQMENKTCTIRTKNIKTGTRGSLLFNSGELYDAECTGFNGIDAAYEIFTWGKVDLSIQNSCHVRENRINTPLQAILLEAMRLKDEKERNEQETKVEETKEDIALSPDNPPAEETLYGSIMDEIEKKKDSLDIYETGSWDGLMQLAEDIGNSFGTGPLRICSVSDGKGMELLLVAGKSNLAVKRIKT